MRRSRSKSLKKIIPQLAPTVGIEELMKLLYITHAKDAKWKTIVEA
jgi:hypothetical protein